MEIKKEQKHIIFMLSAYIGMLIIQQITTVLNDLSYYKHFPLSIPKTLLKYLITGLIIYFIPYKKIQENLHTHISDLCKRFGLDKRWNIFIQLLVNCLVTLLVFYLVICIHADHPWYYYRFRVMEYFPAILALYALIRLQNSINNPWISYFLCCYIWTPLTVILTHYITKRFVFSGIVGISMLLIYLIGMHRKFHKINWLRVIICLLFALGVFWLGMIATHNEKNLLGIFYPDQYISDSVANMIYLIWQNPLFTTPEKTSPFFYYTHPLTAVNMYLGMPVLILFLAFQIAFIVFLYLTWRDALKNSEVNGLLFGCLGLQFIGIYLYSLLGDIGAIPATTINYMFISIDIPILFFMVRLTNVKWRQHRSEEQA